MLTFNAHEQTWQHSVPDVAAQALFRVDRKGRRAIHPTRVGTSTLTPGPMVELRLARLR